MADDKEYRLRVKIGNAEFDAAGEESSVKEQFQIFMTALSAAPASTKKAAPIGGSEESKEEDSPDISGVSHVFTQDGEIVSLKVLPQGKSFVADALILLLYGYRKMAGTQDVLGTRLMKSAKESGLNSIDRVDRVIDTHKAYYIRGGARRGATYRLNNQGMIKAEELMKQFDA